MEIVTHLFCDLISISRSMKIFNWLHRKLHHNVYYQMDSSSKQESISNGEMTSSNWDRDTEGLLHDHAGLVDVLEGWHDGILTIGTFGLDQLTAFSEYSIQGGGGDEVNALAVLEIFEEELKQPFDSENGGISGGAENEMPKSCPLSDVDSEFPLRPSSDAEQKKRKGQRMTLADLFSADVGAAEKCSSGSVPSDCGKKPAFRTKHVRSLAQKLVPGKGEDSGVTRKLHRMITKMLKRKIHPEIRSDVHNGVGFSTDARIVGSTNSDPGFKHGDSGDDGDANESVSLLPVSADG